MKILISFLAVFVMLLAPPVSHAKPHQLTWEWPTEDCDGNPLSSADFIEAELIYSLTPMPMTSDTEGTCSVNRDADPPAGALTVPVPLSDTSIILNLQPGQTYYVRIRVSAYVNNNWSSWSNQAEPIAPYGRPNVIRISSSQLGRMEYWAIETSHLKFFGS